MYWFAHDLGAAGPTPPLLRQAQRRIAADRELIDRDDADLQPRSAPVAGLHAGVLADDDGAGAAPRPRSAPGDPA